jgi:response regulator of citrate/malate metabolism
MTSTDAQREIMEDCLSKGAKDYLIKPLRISMIKGLSKYINKNNSEKE